MVLIHIVLAVAILLCSLVAGIVFCFAIVVMPGIKVLDDQNFLVAFKVMDRVIQNNQPAFMAVWLGSAAAMILLAILGIWQLDGVNRLLAIVSAASYLLGLHLPTVAINIPLNNRLQALDLDTLSEIELQKARTEFESRWVLWNSIRTVVAIAVTFGLVILALQI